MNCCPFLLIEHICNEALRNCSEVDIWDIVIVYFSHSYANHIITIIIISLLTVVLDLPWIL